MKCFIYIIRKKWLFCVAVIGILTACNNSRVKIISRYSDGSTRLRLDFFDKNDRSHFVVKQFFPDGKVQKEAEVKNMQYIGKKVTFFKNGNISQIDSLGEPCDTSKNACDGELIRYDENGTISQRFEVKDGHFNGMSQHYDGKGKLVKTYYLLNDTLKNGEYKEFYDNGNLLRLAMYHLDTLVGYEYIFKENGDTAKYFSHYDGQMDFPYKKWLDDGNILYGIHIKGKDILWTWYDRNGKIIKKKVAMPSKNGYTIPGNAAN